MNVPPSLDLLPFGEAFLSIRDSPRNRRALEILVASVVNAGETAPRFPPLLGTLSDGNRAQGLFQSYLMALQSLVHG